MGEINDDREKVAAFVYKSGDRVGADFDTSRGKSSNWTRGFQQGSLHFGVCRQRVAQLVPNQRTAD